MIADERLQLFLTQQFQVLHIEMVEIEPKSWFFLVFLVLLNFVRPTFMGSVHSRDLCWDYHHPDEADDHRRQLAGAEDEKEKLIHTCSDYVMWYAIVAAGQAWCVCHYHLQKLRLLKLAGINSAEDYVTKLKEFQDQEKDFQSGPDNFKQMSVELKTRIKSRQSLWQKMGTLSFGDTLSTTDIDENPRVDDDVVNSHRRSRRDLLKQDSSVLLEREGAQDSLRLKMHSAFDVDNKYYVSTLVVALGAVSRKQMRHHHEFAHRVLFWLKSICSCFVWNCLTFRRTSTKPKINEKLLESARNLRQKKLKKDENAALDNLESDSVASRNHFGRRGYVKAPSAERDRQHLLLWQQKYLQVLHSINIDAGLFLFVTVRNQFYIRDFGIGKTHPLQCVDCHHYFGDVRPGVVSACGVFYFVLRHVAQQQGHRVDL